ncbi:MAG TPA: Fe-S cluster assembly protein SufD [Anaerolineaceae bacterium]|nr:Fe-S cluster assembly protein SufD [Anaerolineaceae bacterium]
MTSERPKVVIRGRQREVVEQAGEFQFSADQVRTENVSPDLRDFRLKAWETYQSLPMPTTRDEPWRRTDLSRLKLGSFRLPQPNAYLDLAPVPEALLAPMAGDVQGGELLLLPGGGVKTRLASELANRGVIFTDLVTAEREHAGILDKVAGKVVKPAEGKFAALAAGLAQTGVLLYIPRGVQVDQPLHTLLWGPGEGLAHFSHVIVWLEEGASATYIHESASSTEKDQTLHAGVIEVYVGPGANLRFVELQSWGEHVWNFIHERVQVDRDGNVDWVFGAIGGRLTKNFADLNLSGNGATGKMSGFYFTENDQHLDYDSQQNHLAPHGTSDLLFKGALMGQSRVVWQGMIYVAPGAMKTDGYQANRNLVLGSGARADSIPGLEILADDVRCTHGATVGKIDADEVFYLMARGIPRVEAERLVVEGFFDPIMQRIPFEGVRQRFQSAIQEKMQAYAG